MLVYETSNYVTETVRAKMGNRGNEVDTITRIMSKAAGTNDQISKIDFVGYVVAKGDIYLKDYDFADDSNESMFYDRKKSLISYLATILYVTF